MHDWEVQNACAPIRKESHLSSKWIGRYNNTVIPIIKSAGQGDDTSTFLLRIKGVGETDAERAR